MPNHCANDLRVQGKRELIDDFFEKVKDGEDLIAADKIIPYPKKFKDMDAAAEAWPGGRYASGAPVDGYNSGGYDWCVKNWGTKWGFYNFRNLKHFKESSLVSFDTAWAPSIPLIKKASQMFPSLIFTLKYFECGVGFKGTVKFKNGKELLNEYDNNYTGDRGG